MHLSGEIEADEVSVLAGHPGHPDIVAALGRDGRRRRLKGKRGRGALAEEKPPVLSLLPRYGEIVIWMLPTVQPVTIQPVLTAEIHPVSLLDTDECDIDARLDEWEYRHKPSIIRRRNMSETKTVMAFMKFRSTP